MAILIVAAVINLTLLYQSEQADNSQSHSIIKTGDLKVQTESISGLAVSVANGNVEDKDNLDKEIENVNSALTMLKNGGSIKGQTIQKIPSSITSDYNKVVTSWNTYKEKALNVEKTSVFDKEATNAMNYVLQKNSELILTTNSLSKELSDLGRDYNRHKEIANELENSAKEIGQLTLLISIGEEENAQEKLKKEKIAFEVGLQKLLGISTKELDVESIGQEHEELIQIPRENSNELRKLDPLWEALQPKIGILEERALLSPNFNSAKNEMNVEKLVLFSDIDNLLNSWNAQMAKEGNQKQSIIQILLIIDIAIFFLVLYVIRQSLLPLRLITDALSEIKEGAYGEKIEYTEKQKQHIDRDSSFSVKHGQVHYGYKSHIKLDVDNHLIREVEVTTASLHDGEIDLVEEGDKIAYRDKGYFGKKLKAEDVDDKTMKRATRKRKLNGGEQKRNKAISRIRAPGERPFGVIKRVFNGYRASVKTLERVSIKEMLKCFAYNLYQLVTLERKKLAIAL